MSNLFSKKGHMKRHLELVCEKKKQFKVNICGYYSFSQKIKKAFESVHEKKKPFKCDICKYSCSIRETSRDIFNQFMRKRNHWNVTLVTTLSTAVCKKVTWRDILNWFMRKTNHLNVIFVTTTALKRVTWRNIFN